MHYMLIVLLLNSQFDIVQTDKTEQDSYKECRAVGKQMKKDNETEHKLVYLCVRMEEKD